MEAQGLIYLGGFIITALGSIIVGMIAARRRDSDSITRRLEKRNEYLENRNQELQEENTNYLRMLARYWDNGRKPDAKS